MLLLRAFRTVFACLTVACMVQMDSHEPKVISTSQPLAISQAMSCASNSVLLTDKPGPEALSPGSICAEGSCRQGSTAGTVDICASQQWQRMEVAPDWTCCSQVLVLKTSSSTSHFAQRSTSTSTTTHPSTGAPQGTVSSAPLTTTVPHSTTNSLKSIVYYPSWGVYDRAFFPRNITNPCRFSHILHAFAKISEDDTVCLGDPDADLVISDTYSASNGSIQQLLDLKQQCPDLKIILSIGGYSYSEGFAKPASSSDGRAKFADSAIKLMEQYGFDGLDIDWEYPQNKAQGNNFYQLLRLVREKLNNSSVGHALLTAAVSANTSHLDSLPLNDIDAVLDFWILMGYDYAGSFSNRAGHAANIHAGTNVNETPYQTETAIALFSKSGVSSSKLILGMPLYGHDFLETDGPGQPFKSSSKGSWGNDDTGIWDYKAMPLSSDAIVEWDSSIVASWSYDAQTRTMVSFDNQEVATLKARYILEQGLGGAMWWEITGDQPSGSGHSIIDAVLAEFRKGLTPG